MRKITLLIVLGCMHTPAIWAQCWDGTSMNGPVACPPPPNVPGSPVYQGGNSPSPSLPSVWENRWGAIASDDNTGTFGVSANKNSQIEAEQSAIKVCAKGGNDSCRLYFTYHNQCAAIAQEIGGGGGDIAGAPDKNKAEKNSMQECQKHASRNCEIRYSGCSLPVRIR
jgi:hypothetical protein